MSKKECTKTKFTNKKILPSKKLLIILALSAALIFLLSVSSVLALIGGLNQSNPYNNYVSNTRGFNLTTDYNSYGLETAYPPYGFVIYANFTTTNLTVNNTQGPYNVNINISHHRNNTLTAGDSGLIFNISFSNSSKGAWVTLGKNNGTIINIIINKTINSTLQFKINSTTFNLPTVATDVLNISINISNGSSNAVGTNALSTRVEDVAYINFVNITFPSQMIFTNFTQPNQTFNLTMQSHNDTNQSCQLFINATSFANSTISTSNASGAASYTMNGTTLRQLNSTWENNTEQIQSTM